jgi:hypothetical protein
MVKMNYKRIGLIFLLFIISFFLINYYRPFKANYEFNDFGLADSSSGMISIIIVYLVISKKNMPYLKAKELAIWIFALYFMQELLSFFFPFIGVFDIMDLIYYLIGFVIIFCFDVRKKKVTSDNSLSSDSLIGRSKL